MSRTLIAIVLSLLCVAPAGSAGLASLLDQFARYEFGQPKKILHETRLAAMEGTSQEDRRAAHERLLLEFIQSDASLAARRHACLWLGMLGGKKSLPVLAKLAGDKDMGDVASIAERNIRGDGPAAGEPGGHPLARFRAKATASSNPAELLLGAIKGKDECLARLAFELAAEGRAATKVAAAVSAEIANLPPGRQVLALNLLDGIDPAAVEQLARSGAKEVRIAALKRLGGQPSPGQLDLLIATLAANDEDLKAAAHRALAVTGENLLRPALKNALLSKEKDVQQAAIAAAVACEADCVAEDLWTLASRDDQPTRAAAVTALGRIAPPADFKRMLKFFGDRFESPVQREIQTAVFAMARRQTDYDAAAAALEQAAGNAPEKAAKALRGMAAKLSTVKPAQSLEQVRDPKPAAGDTTRGALPPGSFRDLTPSRFEVAAHLNCGPQDRVEQNGIRIECLNGKPWNSGPGTDPAFSVSFAASSLDFRVGGLKPGTGYLLQVLLVSGQDFPGHHWRKTGPVVAGIIEADPRMEVTICETPYALGLKHLKAYDAVFMHFKNYRQFLPSTDAMRANLESYVRGGGGMCLSHFACGAMEEWPQFVELAGRVWDGKGHDRRGPFTVRVVDPNHPVTRGIKDFETDDKLYFCLKGSPGIHLLCDAHSKVKKARQPQAFVLEPGKGRVFLCTLGHDVRTCKPNEVRQLYRQATAWTAGL